MYCAYQFRVENMASFAYLECIGVVTSLGTIHKCRLQNLDPPSPNIMQPVRTVSLQNNNLSTPSVPISFGLSFRLVVHLASPYDIQMSVLKLETVIKIST